MAMDAKVIARMVELSPLDFDLATQIADEFGLKPRAVVASAGRQEGVTYNRKQRVSKTGTPVVSKTDLVTNLSTALDLDVTALDGLDKANKTALEALVTAVAEITG